MVEFSGRSLVLLGILLLKVLAARCADDRPNIIFILADDFGYNDIGYHNKYMRTRNLDREAKGGVILENYYVQPICVPTRSQLISGRYQIHTGLQHGNTPHLPLNSLTMADQLKNAGYKTHMMGKWHLGYARKENLPQYRGFDTFLGYLKGHETYFSHAFPFKKKLYLDWRDENGPRFQDQGTYSAYLLTDRAVRAIKEHNQTKGPMFAYLAYQNVHDPMDVPPRFLPPFRHIKDKKRRTYCAMVAALDEAFGNVTRALRETGMWNNTVLVFSTDNGGDPERNGGNNWPLRGQKFSLFEGGIRANGFVAGGRVGPSGVVNRQLLHVTDWFPTFVNLARGGYNGTKSLDGFDQWETINGTAPSARDTILHNIDILYAKKGKAVKKYQHIWDTRVRAAIRVGDLKLVTGNPKPLGWNPQPPHSIRRMEMPRDDKGKKNLWLFNITADPSERNDLSEKQTQDVIRLMKKLAAFNATAVPAIRNRQDPRDDPTKHGGVWGPYIPS